MNGADQDRTGNPRVANAVLSQLSYGPDFREVPDYNRPAPPQSIEHGPGPPHRPHPPPCGSDFDFGPSAPTANTLSARAVFDDPHPGHFTFASAPMVRTSWSNFLLHASQVYS